MSLLTASHLNHLFVLLCYMFELPDREALLVCWGRAVSASVCGFFGRLLCNHMADANTQVKLCDRLNQTASYERGSSNRSCLMTL